MILHIADKLKGKAYKSLKGALTQAYKVSLHKTQVQNTYIKPEAQNTLVANHL